MLRERKILHNKIKRAKKILLLTHKGPDLDAFCSLLLLYKILIKYYPNKEITLLSRQLPNLRIPGMQHISVNDSFIDDGYDLVLVTDAGQKHLLLEERDKISLDEKEMVYIDHHKTVEEIGEKHLLINNLASSATEEVFATFQDIWGRQFKLDSEMAELIQYGITSDTFRFMYDSTTPETHRVFAEAKSISPIDMEEFTYKDMKFPFDATVVMIEFLKNIQIKGSLGYTYISRDVVKSNNFSKQGLNEAQAFMRDNLLRYIQGVHWWFVLKPEYEDEDNWYVSFRSEKGHQLVDGIAEKLGGGGHQNAAAAKIKAQSAEEALKMVMDTVSEIS